MDCPESTAIANRPRSIPRRKQTTRRREAFVLAFLHVETRRVVLSPATFHPDEAWVAAQAETFVSHARGTGLRVRYVQHDRDGKFAPAFDRALKQRHIAGARSPKHAPNCQAFVERFIGSMSRYAPQL